MLDVKSINNKVDRIENQLIELRALSIRDSLLISQVRTMLLKTEFALSVLDKSLKDTLIRKEGV